MPGMAPRLSGAPDKSVTPPSGTTTSSVFNISPGGESRLFLLSENLR
ncbi:hypothetical protein KCP71_22415 [Salmonella enterica subsp. enterica]|nr:hypothetical protein KCP71_22415 [Salmonella enterica subsp. enterica]